MEEFKTFISRGNVIDMAVGVIIGGAFKSIVDSLVADIINPLIGCIGGLDFTAYSLKLNGEASLNYGNFITAIINFLIMALVIFTMITAINKVTAKMSKKQDETPAVPTTKQCPFCKSEIAIDATKCPHCTSDVE
ncbi:MAG: large conductance mechanosensitive channel protein MscL [Faecalimonas sp.]|nr:large conductance mechanosensitive channel protein MscL [Faecalimonas sp.]